MLQNSDPTPIPAADTRVSTHELTEALATLDARRTREAFARIGTVTLAEGLQDTGVEATPAELYAEIEMLREADAAQEQVNQRQRRLKLILKAEIVSVLLCFLALLGFQRTLLNPTRQQTQQAWQTPQAAAVVPDQAQEFKRLFALTQGSHPSYIISAASPFPSARRDTDTLFPRYWLPDGCTVYEDLPGSIMGFPPKFGLVDSIQFQSADTILRWNQVAAVSYNGAVYLRGWVRKGDVGRMLKGQGFQFYLTLVRPHPEVTAEFVPVTIAKHCIFEAHFAPGIMPNGITLLNIPPGSPIHLDSHAWEQYPVPPGRS